MYIYIYKQISVYIFKFIVNQIYFLYFTIIYDLKTVGPQASILNINKKFHNSYTILKSL